MPSRIKYFLPSIAQSVFVIILFHLCFNVGRNLLADCDTGFHIKAGEYMIQTRSLPEHDPFSLFTPPVPWPTHEWLSDVIMASIEKISGLSGVVIFFMCLISITYSFLYRVLRTNKGNIIIDIALIILVLVTSQIHWLARPHAFTVILLLAWYYIIDSFQNDRNNFLYLLPPIMLLWVNLHGGFILGFIMIAIYLLYNTIKSYRSKDTDKEGYQRKGKYILLAMMASVLVSLANPKGFHTLVFPFEVVSNRLIMDNYGEFLSPNFHSKMYTPFRFFLLLMIAFFAAFKGRLNFIEVMLVLIFSNMALFSGRYVPLFAMMVAPILSKNANIMLHQTNSKFTEALARKAKVQESIDESARGYVWPVAAVLVVMVVAAGDRANFRFDETVVPVAAVEFMKKERIPGNMFNNDEFGDYIIYRAYPRYKVFFDGRADIYGKEKLQDYLNVFNMNPGWEKVFEKYNVNWVIWNVNTPLSQYLTIKKDWKLIYSDNVATIHVKNNQQNLQLINKYAIGK